jgi:hypothetical protein
MLSFSRLFTLTILFVTSLSLAEKAGVKVGDIDTKENTSIIIKKGAAAEQCVHYEIVSGNEEVFGTPEFDRTKAYASWKTACNEWRQSLKEMNKDNQLITLNCNSPQATKEDEHFTYRSSGSYKIKIKMKDKN